MSVRTAGFKLPPLSPPVDAFTQQKRCATEVAPQSQSLIRAKVKARLARAGLNLRPLAPVVIPVHMHVINKGRGAENGDVAADVLQRQVDHFNECFSGSGFQFALASVDRTTKPEWYDVSTEAPEYDQMKAALHQGGLNELNLYLANPHDASGDLLGEATFPWQGEANPEVDGVVIDNLTLPGSTWPAYNGGDSAVHEIGHWLGLWHTFENGCGQPGDEISDTPPQRDPGYGTPEHQDSCPALPGEDPVHNFMDYGDDANLNEFTPEQQDRMRAHWAVYRQDGGGVIARANATADLPVNDGQMVTSTLTIDRDIPFQSMKLNFTVADDDESDPELPEDSPQKGPTHNSTEDLVISLRSPSGKDVVIVDRQRGVELLDVTYEIQSLFPGEPTKGDWTLSVEDTAVNGQQGKLATWSLIFGAQKPS